MDTVIGAVAHTNGLALANPPLPILFGKKSAKKTVFQPYYFQANETAEFDIKTIDVEGYGLAGLFNHMLTDSLGYYLTASVTQVNGEVTSPGQNNSGIIRSSDIDSQLLMVGGGATFTLINNSFLTLPVFAGPMFVTGKFSSSILHTDASGTVLDDFDAEGNPSFVGVQAGVQAGFHFSEHFSLNPYFVITRPLSDENNCQQFEATEVRTSGGLFDLNGQGCRDTEDSARSRYAFDIFVQSFGLNLLFPSIGLSVNAYAEAGEVPSYEGTKIKLFFLSFMLGTP
jgi:hypothetical protein